MKLAYLANIRLPTEKAHGLQIMQMCEAFAQNDTQGDPLNVTLYAARRINTEALRTVEPFLYYGVRANFTIRRVPCLDLHPLSAGRFEGVAFALQTLTYTLCALVWMLFTRADLYYSRDPLTVLALSLIKPRAKLAYEAHQLYKTGRGHRLQRRVCRRAGLVVAITGFLAAELATLGARPVITAHDGYRAERFADMPDQATARNALRLMTDSFIIGYSGRLHTMGMSKGIDTLIDALALCRDLPLTLLIVGGPDDWVTRYRAQWISCGLPPERFVAAGTVPAEQVPLYLTACDVLAMPLPWTEHYAYFTSALKLFEYMIAARAILASDLPGTAEVLRDGGSALLFKPGDAESAAGALRRLYADPALRERLSAQAAQDVWQYAWTERAGLILKASRSVHYER